MIIQLKLSYFTTMYNTNNLQDKLWGVSVFKSIILLVVIAISIPSVTEELNKTINHTCFSLLWRGKNERYFPHNRGDKQGFMSRGLKTSLAWKREKRYCFWKTRIMEAKLRGVQNMKGLKSWGDGNIQNIIKVDILNQ